MPQYITVYYEPEWLYAALRSVLSFLYNCTDFHVILITTGWRANSYNLLSETIGKSPITSPSIFTSYYKILQTEPDNILWGVVQFEESAFGMKNSNTSKFFFFFLKLNLSLPQLIHRAWHKSAFGLPSVALFHINLAFR